MKTLRAFTFEHEEAGLVTLVFRSRHSYDANLGKFGTLYTASTETYSRTRAEAERLLREDVRLVKERVEAAEREKAQEPRP